MGLYRNWSYDLLFGSWRGEGGGRAGGGGGLAALKEDPRGFIQKCKTKFRISRAVAENVLF